jgi:RNA polymerase sigma-70 factor (ECF subfamily)
MPSTHIIHQQLATMHPALFRFAFLQLRNKALAEDAVQEALLAVLETPDRFAGRSSFRTYVTGILKFKIIDILRLNEKEKQLPYNDELSDSDIVDSLFTSNGHTINVARAWSEPDIVLEQKNFLKVLEVCLEKLPAKSARVFMMRELLDLETEEICKELDLSISNFGVLLFRARIKLRGYLDMHWFSHQI